MSAPDPADRGPRRLSRLASWVLRRALPAARALEVAGDLEEAGRRENWSRARTSLNAISIATSSAGERARVGLLQALADDLRESGRHVLRTPAVTLAVAGTLALGIGANATMFQIVDRLLLSPPDHVSDPERVVRLFVERANPRSGERWVGSHITYPDFRDFDSASTFSAEGYGGAALVVGRGTEARRVQSGWATAGFFPLLGVSAERGRFFADSEDRVDGDPVAVLGYEYWQARLGGDEDVLGQSVYIRGTEFTIVGIAPRGFTGVDLATVDIWLPLHVAGAKFEGEGFEHSRGWYWLQAIGRLEGDAPIETARAEATALHRAGRAEYIEQERYDAAVEILLGPLIAAQGPNATGASRVAALVAGVTLIVLLIACANVGNLLLSHGLSRRREMAVRLALGVSRARLVRLMLAEALWMALLGGAAGLLLAYGGGRLLRDALLPNVAITHSLVSARVLLFTALASLLAGLVAAAAPALFAGATEPARDLKAGERGASARASRTRQLLTVTQGVLSVVLLVGAGLFVRSLDRVQAIDMGFEPDGLAMVSLLLEPRAWGDEERGRLWRDALEAAEAAPGVAHASIASSVPFAGSWSVYFAVPGVDLQKPASGGPYVYGVTPDYFAAMGMRLVRGRLFSNGDDAPGSAVTVVTESMARGIWGVEDPLGECVVVGSEGADCTRVVGVVANTRRQEIIEREQWLYYLPLAQGTAIADLQPAGLVLRAASDVRAMLPDVRERLLGIPGVDFVNSFPFQRLTESQVRSWRLGATMFSLFGGLASVVAAIGLYSVLAFAVARRRRELGIRSALGSPPGRIAALILREALGVALVSVVLGLVIAALAAPLLGPLLFEVSPRDPLVLAAVAGLLLAVAGVVAVGPALRARAVDPVLALGAE